MNSQWRRVTKAIPCEICQKGDWCCLNPEAHLVLCMRISSNRPSRGDQGGWLHPLGNGPRTLPPSPKPVPTINSGKLLREWGAATKKEWIERLAKNLGVSYAALLCFGPVWAAPHRAWGFPMKDGYGEIVGIRLRANSGFKWTVSGSHTGLFIPDCPAKSEMLVCEGLTDSIAALTLGYFPVGRPSCSGGVSHIVSLVRRLGVLRVIIVGDNDQVQREDGTWWSPGCDGAETLSRQIPVPSCIVVPPSKDLRIYVQQGGTSNILNCLISNLIWNQPKNRT